MRRKINLSISVPLEGALLKKTNQLLTNLYKKYNIKFIRNKNCRPHINLFSGETTHCSKIKKILNYNKKKFKKIKLVTNGVGVFLSNKPTIYLRFKSNKLLYKIRHLLFKNRKYWKKIDDSVQIDQWIAKTTLVHKDLSLNSFSSVSKYILKKNIVEKMYSKELIFLDFTKSEEEIDHIKL